MDTIDVLATDPVSTREDVIDRIRHRESDLRRRFYAESLYLYGSAARDELSPESDIDVFIDYDHDGPFSFVELIQAGEYLQSLLGRRVDFTTRDGLHPRLRDRIEKSSIKVF